MTIENIKDHSNPSFFLKREIEAEDLTEVLRASLLFSSEDGNDSLEIYVTDEPQIIERLADSREGEAEKLREAPVVVAFTSDRSYDGAWVENCSRSLWMMCMQAACMDISFCIVQIRGYALADGTLSDEVVRGILNIPENKIVYSLVALGYAVPSESRADKDNIGWERVHVD